MAFASLLNDRFPRQAEVWLPQRPRPVTASHVPTAEAVPSYDLSVHPAPVVIGLASCAWFLVLSWTCFGAFDLRTGLAVAIVTIISAMYLGGITLGAYNSNSAANDRAAGQRRSFRQFLHGRVDIATGLVSGREAMLQIALLPVSLAVGATAMALIWLTIR
ncbi:hypothetical protein [Hyphomicrobium sp. MC8b]|jgi:hypothetical protein|uniref:hypothetical protein n=1 Tax=unclassified Hyphomicrobium TaxID=2619925 RepID=UPI003919F9F9